MARGKPVFGLLPLHDSRKCAKVREAFVVGIEVSDQDIDVFPWQRDRDAALIELACVDSEDDLAGTGEHDKRKARCITLRCASSADAFASRLSSRRARFFELIAAKHYGASVLPRKRNKVRLTRDLPRAWPQHTIVAQSRKRRQPLATRLFGDHRACPCTKPMRQAPVSSIAHLLQRALCTRPSGK
jgi:hypothetical protein